MESKPNYSEKRTSPRENANPFSIICYLWMFPIFKKGFKGGLKEDDLYKPLNQHKSNSLGDCLENAWYEEEKIRKPPSLRRVLFKVFGPRFMLYGLLKCLNEINLVIMQPLSLGFVVAYFNTGQTEITQNQVYMYAGFMVLSFVVDLLVAHSCMMGLQHLSMKIRISCCSLIYRKSMKLSKAASGETTVGQVVNLLSNDVERFDTALMLGHFLWIGPLETGIVTYLTYKEIGVSAIIGIVFLMLFVPLQLWFGKKSSMLRLRTALRTDERVRLMNEIIAGIQVIKMYTWEKPFAKLVDLARRNEIKYIKSHSYILGFVFSFSIFITRTSVFSSILAYVLLGNNISAEKVFTVIAFYNVIRPIMTMIFAESISAVAEVNVSMQRLNKFMLLEERTVASIQTDDNSMKHVHMNGKSNGSIVSAAEEKPSISLKNMTAKWVSESEEPTLNGVNLEANSGELIGVIGPVGSGKSSLLNALLKEIPLTGGSLDISGKISYASQEPWLFSGSVRQNILFGEEMDENRYRNILRVCALERDISLFAYGDRTLVGERGKTLSGGQKARINLARAVYRKADIYLFDDPLSAVDAHVGKQLFEDCITGFLKDKIVVLVTHQLQYLKNTNKILILKSGSVVGQGSYRELKSSGLDFAELLEEHQQTPNELEAVQTKVQEGQYDSDSDDEEPTAVKEYMKKGSVGAAVYGAYFKAAGGWFPTLAVLLLFAAAQGSGSASDYYITHWVNREETFYQNMNHSNGTMSPEDQAERENIIYVYSGLTLATIVVSIIRSFMFFLLCMTASINLHNFIFTNLSKATMKFFNNNPSGRILNRFSKDMGKIDEILPMLMFDCFEISMQFIGVVVITAMVNLWLLIPSFTILSIVLCMRLVYLRTSRSVKRLEGVTKSPVFAHMSASMQGLTTIRAFSAQKNVISEFDNFQDNHSSAWFIFITSSRTFGFWMDFCSIIYISLLTITLTTVQTEESAGDVGLIITQYIGMIGMLQWGVRQWTELENEMTSVERVLEYTQIEQEPNKETKKYKTPPRMWPEFGNLKFRNVCLSYIPEDPPVLKNLCFSVKAKEKIGIVGRTGAGKSSLIAALFQLYETEGNIFIDEVDTKEVSLEDLRSKISIIPQEPVLFSGTMRKNLDPFEEYSDADLWSALEQVELKQVIADLPHQLSSKMSEGGSNFSVGQRQLVCLARAIIRNNRILVLDEATANVDPQTDALIQATIRRKFKDCSVLTIAHRLHTVMDSDKVLVMDAGQAVEFDHPHVLLQNENGVLYKMLQKTGSATAINLADIAEKSYKESASVDSQ